jgi:hypothetical protein
VTGGNGTGVRDIRFGALGNGRDVRNTEANTMRRNTESKGNNRLKEKRK